jgi:hypothetical protein
MVGSASGIRRRYQELSPVLDERGRRRFAATEARAYGYGGVSVVSRITGMARSTIGRGVEEIIAEKQPVETGRIRQPGGGRKTKRSEDSTLLPDLERLVEPATRGDPMRVLRWTSKSLRHLAEALHGQGHWVCPHVMLTACVNWDTVYRPTVKPGKAAALWIGMPSFTTSMIWP